MKKLILVILIGLGALIYVYRVDLIRAVQTVDTNSPEALRTSIAEINKGLSEDEKVIFANGIKKMSAEGTDLPTMLAMSGNDEIQWNTLTKSLNGKTVRQILAKGKE